MNITLPPEALQALPENTIREVPAGNRAICILKKGGTLFAFSASCPHAGAAMCEGFVDARGSVVCPAHGYRFDPKNGYNRSGEGYKLRTYPVTIEEDGSATVQLP